jgi:ankyrin repeat protein
MKKFYLSFLILLSLTGVSIAQELDIFRAARQGDLAVIHTYAKSGQSLNVQNGKGYTPVIIATYNQQKAAVKTLIAAGANPCLPDKTGQTALMGVAFHGDVDMAQILLQNHCDINATSKAGQTALMFAAMFGRYEMAEFLLNHDAKTSYVNAQGKSAIDLAESQGNSKMVNLLSRALPKH